MLWLCLCVCVSVCLCVCVYSSFSISSHDTSSHTETRPSACLQRLLTIALDEMGGGVVRKVLAGKADALLAERAYAAACIKCNGLTCEAKKFASSVGIMKLLDVRDGGGGWVGHEGELFVTHHYEISQRTKKRRRRILFNSMTPQVPSLPQRNDNLIEGLNQPIFFSGSSLWSNQLFVIFDPCF